MAEDAARNQVLFGWLLGMAGTVAAIATMATAWAWYPGGYDWLNRDLSTLGRIFTVNGRGHHLYFSIYNFGLLLWGMSAILFFSCRAMLLSQPAAVRRTLICGALAGLGLVGIGVTPADAPNGYWHVVSSGTAILALFVAMFGLNQEAEPGKRWWFWSSLAILVLYPVVRTARLPHGDVVFQKLFVLYVYSYLLVQSGVLFVQLRRGERRVTPEALAVARRFGTGAVAVGCLGMVGLMLAAIAAFPPGFDWSEHWTSYLGNIFYSFDQPVRDNLNPRYMIYDYALAVGGAGLVAFWSVRALRAPGRWAGHLMLTAGFVMGCALIGIGMAPTPTLGLHRLCINLFMLTVLIELLLLWAKGAGSVQSRGARLFWPGLIVGSAVLFALLGNSYGKMGQKVLILEVVGWLLSQGFERRQTVSEASSSNAAASGAGNS